MDAPDPPSEDTPIVEVARQPEIVVVGKLIQVFPGRDGPPAAYALPLAETAVEVRSPAPGSGAPIESIVVELAHRDRRVTVGPLGRGAAEVAVGRLFGSHSAGIRAVAAVLDAAPPAWAAATRETLFSAWAGPAGRQPGIEEVRLAASAALGGLGVDVAAQGRHAVRVEWRAGARRAVLVLYSSGTWVLQGAAAGDPLGSAQAARIAAALGWPDSPPAELRVG